MWILGSPCTWKIWNTNLVCGKLEEWRQKNNIANGVGSNQWGQGTMTLWGLVFNKKNNPSQITLPEIAGSYSPATFEHPSFPSQPTEHSCSCSHCPRNWTVAGKSKAGLIKEVGLFTKRMKHYCFWLSQFDGIMAVPRDLSNRGPAVVTKPLSHWGKHSFF